MLKCSACKQLKAADDFHRCKSNVNRGRSYYCKVCYKHRYDTTDAYRTRRREYMRIYRQTHLEAYRKYHREYQRVYSRTHPRKPRAAT